MGTNVYEIKHAAKLREWTARVAECRSSGVGVKAWCMKQGIALKTYYNWERQIVKAATSQYEQSSPVQNGMLVQVSPDALPSEAEMSIKSAITIRYGESIISMPVGSSTETIVELLKGLNRHA